MSGRTIRAGVVRSPEMSPRSTAAGRPVRRFAMTILGLALAVILGACSGATGPSFEPSGPCTADGSAPGAYPDLEALVPTSYEERGPNRLDSGRNCSDENLKSMCQGCHLHYDRHHHAETAYRTRREGKAAGDLFEDAA